jgi:hypothetical protein
VQEQDAGGVSGSAGARAGAEQLGRVVLEGEDCEDHTPSQRSKVWEMVKIIDEGSGTRLVKDKADPVFGTRKFSVFWERGRFARTNGVLQFGKVQPGLFTST